MSVRLLFDKYEHMNLPSEVMYIGLTNRIGIELYLRGSLM